jgi:outer membrane protein
MTRVVLFTTILSVWSCVAWAQPTTVLTLEDAITRGLVSSSRVQEARAREAAAAASRDGRKSLSGPTASVTTSYVRTNHVDEFAVPQPGGGSRVIFPDIPNNWRLRADVMYPIWTGGRTDALVEGASAELVAAQADGTVVAADLAMEIAWTYWQVVTTRATVVVLDEGLARTDVWVADVRARVEAGVSSPHEVAQAQAHRARQRVQRIQAAQAATLAERELARLVGLPAGQSLELATPVDRPLAVAAGATAAEAETHYTRAVAGRTERAALSARRDAFAAAARAAMAALHPQVATFAGIEPARPNSRFVPRSDRWHTSWDLGLSVTWSLWDNGRARADRALALAQADALTHRQREFESRLAVEVSQRLLDLESGRAAVEASAEAVAAAAEVHRVMRERYDAGVSTSTEVLDAHIAWLDASLERTRLLAALRIAESRLQRTLGDPIR